MYEAKNPQQGMRLDDQIGLSSQRAFPNPPPAEIEATIPQAQTTPAEPPKTPSKEKTPRKPRNYWKDMNEIALDQLTMKPGPERTGALQEKAKRKAQRKERENLPTQEY